MKKAKSSNGQLKELDGNLAIIDDIGLVLIDAYREYKYNFGNSIAVAYSIDRDKVGHSIGEVVGYWRREC